MDQEPVGSPARVADAAIELGRAELRLALSHAKRAVKGAAPTSALVWVASWVAHVAIALICIAPLLAWFRPWPVVLASVAPAVGLAIVLSLLALWRSKSLLARRNHSEHQPPRALEQRGTT